MLKRRALPALLLMCAAPAVAGQHAAATVTTVPALTRTDQLARQYVGSRKLPGIAIAIGRGAEPPHYVLAGRIADGSAPGVAAASLWRVYSMTKPVTGMAAMLLIEDGRLRLDQPIAEILPAFRSMRVLTKPSESLAARPARRQITVRHLLTHTAGFDYSLISSGPLASEYQARGILPMAISTAFEAQMAPARPNTLQAFAQETAKLPLLADPGTRWHYSIGYDVLAAVVEKAAGMPFDRFVRTRIFDPLGMRDSYWTVPAAASGRLASNYLMSGTTRILVDPGAGSLWTRPPEFPYGGAGLVMSARDYDQFLAMLLNGGTLNGRRVMKQQTVSLALSNLLPAGVTYSEGGVKMGFGAGGYVALNNTTSGLGKGSFGWGGAAGTMAWIDPVRRARVTMMVNYSPPEHYPLQRELRAAFHRDWPLR